MDRALQCGFCDPGDSTTDQYPASHGHGYDGSAAHQYAASLGYTQRDRDRDGHRHGDQHADLHAIAQPNRDQSGAERIS
jgi:hypothetical protein